MSDDALLLGALDLNDGVNFTKLEGWSWGTYANERTQRRKLRGSASWGPSRRDGWIECGGRIMVEPTTPGDAEQLRVLLGLLQAELAKEQTTMTATPKGMVAPVNFIVAGDPADVPDDLRLQCTKKPIIELHLWRQPMSTLALESVGPTTISTPAVVDLSAMKGEHRAPLDILLSAPDTNDLHAVWMAWVPEEHAAWVDGGGWIVEAEGLTWDGGSIQSDLYGYPANPTNNSWRAVTQTIHATVPDTGLPPGPFLILPHATLQTGCSLATPWGDTLAPVEGEHWQELAHHVLPGAVVRGAATSSWQLTMTGGATDAYLDRLAFLPTQWGFWRWHKASGHSHAVQIEAGTPYLDNVCNLADVVGSGIEALGGRLLIVTDRENGQLTGGVQSVALTYSYDPRLTLW